MRVSYILLLLLCNYSFSQVLNSSNPQVQAALGNAQVEGNPLANFFQKRTPAMDILFPLIKDDDGIERHYVGAEIGSAYAVEEFQPAKVFYNDQELGDVYYRFNAYNNEIEIKKTELDEEKQLALIKNEEVKIIDGSNELLYRTFINQKKKKVEGYLILLSRGDKYTLYKRLYKKFSEAKPAANSMVAPIPSRFSTYTEYYYQKSSESDIKELPQRKSKLLKELDQTEGSKVKELLKSGNFDLKVEDDLKRLFATID